MYNPNKPISGSNYPGRCTPCSPTEPKKNCAFKKYCTCEGKGFISNNKYGRVVAYYRPHKGENK